MNEFRVYCNDLPEVRAARYAMAKLYRKLRREGQRDMAALVYRRVRAAQAIIREDAEGLELYTSGTMRPETVGGLALLLRK